MQRWLFLATGCFVSFVGLVLLLAPHSYFQLYATQYDPGMDLPARRFAPAVVALWVVLIMARSRSPGRFLASLSLICALAFLGVAATGLLAWSSGVARPTILWAAVVEGSIAVLFFAVWLRMPRE